VLYGDRCTYEQYLPGTLSDVLCCVAQWLHGACQKKGMPLYTMQQIVHSLEKICDKYYNMIIKYFNQKGCSFQFSVFQSPRVMVVGVVTRYKI
jgi:hypothetical protein